MVTMKKNRSLRLPGLIFTVCMLAPPVAHAQTLMEATVLTTNVDVQKRKLYVEMNWTPKACGDYQLRFKLTSTADNDGRYGSLVLDSVITNNPNQSMIGDFQLTAAPEAGVNIKVLNLDKDAVGGYALRFAIPPSVNITTLSNPKVCMETFKKVGVCKYCGISREDRKFTPRDIYAGCPYLNLPNHDDLVACYERQGGAKNWEAWIQDPRDCKMYRIVQVGGIGGSWWFAQNLDYREGLSLQTLVTSGATASAYFCPNRSLSGVDVDEGRRGCDEYGALYPWETARALDGGVSTSYSSESVTPSTTAASTIRGVCPPNWFLPNDAQWGYLLNLAEGCAQPGMVDNDRTPHNPPCNHMTTVTTGTTDVATAMVSSGTYTSAIITDLGNMGGTAAATMRYNNLGEEAGKRLKATNICGTVGVNCDNRSIIRPENTPNVGSEIKQPSSRSWMRSVQGTDYYGMSVLAAGYLYAQNGGTGGTFYGRGQYAAFMTATRWDNAANSTPIVRLFSYDRADVRRLYSTEASGLNSAYSVRCIR